MCNNWSMKRRRIILLGLLVIAVGMVVEQIIWPDAGLELLCYVYAVPVMVVNSWEWFGPGIMNEGLSSRKYGVILTFIGALIVAYVFLSIPLHLASVGFGPRKLIGVVVGGIAFAAGLVATFNPSPPFI
jgi:hypothetical protein